MSDKDWYASQGISFQYKQPDYTQNNPPQQTTAKDVRTPPERKKIKVIASESNPFGQKTLAGLTLIIFTLSIQLLVLVIGGFSSPADTTSDVDDLEEAIEDLETARKTQLWFSIFIVCAQLVGLKMIYDDVRNLSEHLDHDVEVRNSNLNVLAKKINQK